MEETSTIARPYALAAFKQAQEEEALDQWADMIGLLRAVATDPAVSGLIANPRVERMRLADLILDICGSQLSETGKNFVKVLAENRRLSLIAEIDALYAHELALYKKLSMVEVTTAFPLSAGQEESIRKAMAKRLGQAVELAVATDATLIGGVVIRAGDVVIDGSLRGRLRQLSLELS